MPLGCSALGEICRTCKGFRGFRCTGKSAQMSVLVAAFSWSRKKEINELAKDAQPVPPPWQGALSFLGLLHLGLGVGAALGQSHPAKRDSGRKLKVSRNNLLQKETRSRLLPCNPNQACRIGAGVLPGTEPKLSIWRWTEPVRGAGAAMLLCCRPSRALAMLHETFKQLLL